AVEAAAGFAAVLVVSFVAMVVLPRS
ncbi:MAG: hypothetical protein JWO90_1603, partial [Solirubrobacterales bacterium]|nr:hypothetical protein [Solirubrobacterales bacterium]